MQHHATNSTVLSFPPSTSPAPPPAGSIRFIKPTLPDLEGVIAIYRDVYASGLITNSSLVERLEAAVASYLGVKHCVAVSSCTSGLMLVMKCLDLTGEVIVPSFTFFASGEAILWNQLKPVFADCVLDTWNVDPADVARRVTTKTAAILGVHMYGNPCDVEALTMIAGRTGTNLLFDGAHAFGSSHHGRPIGGFGDAEVFSLSPTKLLVAGEGGLVTTNDAALARRLRAARNYGDLGAYDPEVLGLNARMAEFNAAVAIGGLGILEQKIARHGQIAAAYTALLSGLPGVRFQRVPEGNLCTYKDFSIHVSSPNGHLTAPRLCAELEKRSIPTKRYFYPPLHQQQIFSGLHTSVDLPLTVTEYVSKGVVSLPIYESLPDSTIEAIAQAVREIVLQLGTKENHQ